jgi:ribA/ribD-fused uncharacterized protein
MTIDRFVDDYAFLSNFYAWDLTYRGIYYPTAEHAFQAAKSDQVSNKLMISHAETPGKAKRLGRQITIRDDWEDVKLRVMLEILIEKFAPTDRMDQLKATAPHNLVEGNYWHDQFWGNCFCPDHQNDKGSNKLGLILKYIRNLAIADPNSN